MRCSAAPPSQSLQQPLRIVHPVDTSSKIRFATPANQAS